MNMDSDRSFNLDYIISISAELFTKHGGRQPVGYDVIVDQGDDTMLDEDDLIVEPPPQYGCTALGPLKQIGEDSRFCSWYFIQLWVRTHLQSQFPNQLLCVST